MTLTLLSFPLDRTSKAKAEAAAQAQVDEARAVLTARQAQLKKDLLADLSGLVHMVENDEVVTIGIAWISADEYTRSTFYIGKRQASGLYVALDRLRGRIMAFMSS